MSESNSFQIHRREFLQGAATVVGSVALGVGASHGEANRSVVPQNLPMLSVGYWDGERIQNAENMGAGDSRLLNTTVHLRISSDARESASINAIDLNYQTSDKETMPYHAWTRLSHRESVGIANLPVLSDGISITISHDGIKMPYRFALEKNQGASTLREGTYFLAAGTPAWGMYSFDPEGGNLTKRTLSGFMPAEFEHVKLVVAKS